MVIAIWSVRLLQDNKKNHQLRTAFIALVLKHQRFGIASLSETRLADRGQLEEAEGGTPIGFLET